MSISQFFVFLLTFLIFGLLVVLVKKSPPKEKEVIYFSIGDKDFIAGDDEEQIAKKLLHTAQIVREVKKDKLQTIEVPFPKNGREFVVRLVRVLNYNSEYSNRQLLTKDDDKFWVLVSEGQINSNSVTIEINSYIDIDVDVEFYGTDMRQLWEDHHKDHKH